jgi:methionyl aminopeptidase
MTGVSMITIKNQDEINRLKEGGKILADVLNRIVRNIKAGVGTEELDVLAERLMIEKGGRPSFKGYSNGGVEFPTSICVCLNDEIVHAPAVPNRIISSGDMVSIDLGMEYKGMYTDMATTVAVGKISSRAKKLMKVTRKSLDLAIREIKGGNLLSAVSGAIQRYVERSGFNVVRDLVGHGVGFAVHEEPAIPNFVDPRHRPIVLKEGMVLAIEPMVVEGDFRIDTLDDDWTAVTADGLLSAHFEHTVVVGRKGGEAVTKI